MAFPQTVLPIKVELYVNAAWTDITSYVQSREDIVITRGQPNEGGSDEPSTMTLVLNNRDGRFSPRNPTGTYYRQIGRNTPIRCSIIGEGYAQITQQTTDTIGTCSITTTDKAALDITGDIDIRADLDLTSWRDAMELVSKWTETGNQRSYAFALGSNGTIQLWHSPDGTSVLAAVSTVPVPITTGRLAVRATLAVSSGGNRIRTFYTSDSISGTWTQLGAPVVTAGTTSIFSGSGIAALLDNPNASLGGSVIHGRLYGAEIRNGIGGTIVAKPDLTAQASGVTSFADAYSNTWTVNSSLGSLIVTTSDPRFTGEVTSWPQRWDTTGRDVWTPIECADIRRRLGQGAQPLQSPIYQADIENTALKGYWPCEDESNSTSLASARVGLAPLKFRGGTPTLASSSTFLGSKPLPVFNSTEFNVAIPSYTSTGAIQIRMLLAVPAGGTVNGSSIIRLTNSGTIPIWNLTYGTGGSMGLTARDKDDVLVSNVMPATGFALNGRPVYLSLELNNSGANVVWRVSTVGQGDTTAGSDSGTLVGFQISRALKLEFNHGLTMVDVTAGHVTLETAITSVYSIGLPVINGYSGETAGSRLSRLCANAGVPFQSAGFHSASTRMGVQTTSTLLTLIQEAVDADGGQLFSPKDWAALAYRPASALFGQPADVTLNYAAHEMDSLQPVEDDQNLHNDVTVSRTGGSSARATVDTGPLSTQAPPAGVGVYDTSISLNLYSDDQLIDQASWRARVGTVDEARYPKIALNLASPALTGLAPTVASTDIGSRLVITHPPAWVPPDDISQTVIGYTEKLAQYTRTLEFVCKPSSPFDQTGIYGTSYADSRYSPDSCVLASAYSSFATSFSVTTVPLWTTTGVPFDILLAGERCTVTAISGTSNPQTMTVVRAVNGVSKAQLSGESVTLFSPAYYVF